LRPIWNIEAKGGSLMAESLKAYPAIRAHELLNDLFDAEIPLHDSRRESCMAYKILQPLEASGFQPGEPRPSGRSGLCRRADRSLTLAAPLGCGSATLCKKDGKNNDQTARELIDAVG
jgi:hypothetical protein